MAKMIEFKCVPIRLLFSAKDSDYKIYATESTEGSVAKNQYGNTTILGNMSELSLGIEYTVKALESNSKYGIAYRIKTYTRDKPLTENGVRLFLEEILPFSQVNEIMREYPNIIDLVVNNRMDEVDLDKLYNIKHERIKVIQRKILENFVFAQVVEEFQGLLDFKIVKELYNTYKDVDQIKTHVKDNPYGVLTSIGGLDFKNADSLLMKFEKDCESLENPPIKFDEPLVTSYLRMEGCVIYAIGLDEFEGNTKIHKDKLHKLCKSITPQCIKRFNDVLSSSKLVVIDEYVSKASTYDCEVKIANWITEGLKSSTKWDIDISKYKDSGEFPLSDMQMKAIQNVMDYNVSVLNGFGGCVDCDTEYFNGERWVRIADYKDGDKVLQFNNDRTANLVSPEKYIKLPCDYMWHMKNQIGSIDQVLSDEHRVVYETSKGNIAIKSMSEIVHSNNSSKKGFHGKFLNSFDYSGEGIDYTDDEIRVIVATMADGHFKNDTTMCRFNLKKKRKQERLRLLLKNAKIEWTEHSWNPKDKEYINFMVNVPLREKEFSSMWYNCTKHQFEIILDECMYWDGHVGEKGRMSFSTTSKESADFIQFVASSCGHYSSITTYDRTGQKYTTNNKQYIRKSIEYDVHVSKNKNVKNSITKDSRRDAVEPITKYKTIDGYKYCFTVSSGMLVLRRNNRIFITGNSGKSFSTKTLIKILNDNDKSVTLLAPTGRAGKVLSGYTKHPASTIHRKLYSLFDGAMIEDDVVIVDEISMADIFLFSWLLSKIDLKYTKLLLIGDSAQIPSINAGNILHDIINSNTIPTTTLTQIFRYGVGGVMTVATNTRNQEKFLEEKEGVQIIGEDKGYVFYHTTNPKNALTLIKQFYTKLLVKNSPEDILILSPYNIGNNGSQIINSIIQPIANPQSVNNPLFIESNDTKFYVGDLVLQTKNNYKSKRFTNCGFDKEDSMYASLDRDEDVLISNGDIGKIEFISGDKCIINFDNIKVVYDKFDMGTCLLGYSISVTRAQGGNAKNIILVTMPEHERNLNSNLLYVGETRARERVYHIGSYSTVNKALAVKAENDRKTHLKRLLMEGN